MLYIRIFIISLFFTPGLFAQEDPCPVDEGVIGVSVTPTITETEILQPPAEDLTHFYKAASTDARVIYWLYGLGGEPDAWIKPGTATKVGDPNAPGFPARQNVECDYPTYSENSLLGAAATLDTYLNSKQSLNTSLGITDKTRNFVIAHSQGGIVARRTIQMQQQSATLDEEFGGLVTFGSAHQGAAILNNGIPVNKGGKGQILSFATEACQDLADGPLQEPLSKQSALVQALLNNFNISSSIVDLSRSGCEIFGEGILPIVTSQYTQGITMDYMENSAGIVALNSYVPANFSMVAFYGVEESPQFWRTMNTLAHKANSAPVFQSNDDETQLDFRAIRAHYYQRWRINKDLEDYHGDWCSWLLPWRCERERGYRKTREAYGRGLDFIDKANDKWMNIIGARTTTRVVDYYLCKCESAGRPPRRTVFPSSTGCPSSCSTTKIYKTTSTIAPNDGIVKASSASNLPGAIVKGNEDYSLDNTNHQQMRNNSELEPKLLKLYDGDYGQFFKTF